MSKTIKPSLSAIAALERRVWQAMIDGDPQADGAMLTEDFMGLYPSGFSDRAEHMAALEKGPVTLGYSIDKERLEHLAQGVVLYAYRAQYTQMDGTEAQMYVASIWRLGPEGWRNSFSMDAPSQ